MIRVSSLISTFGLSPDPYWFTSEGRRRGQAVHWVGEQVLRRNDTTVQPELQGYQSGLMALRDTFGWQPVTIEKRLNDVDVTGRPDTIGFVPYPVGKVHAGPAVADIKSGLPYASHAIQLAIYERLAERNGIRDLLPSEFRDLPFTRWGWYVKPDGDYRNKVYPEPTDRLVSDALVTLYRFRKAHGLIVDSTEAIDDPSEIGELAL